MIEPIAMMNAISTGTFNFTKPEIMLLIIPAVIILILIMVKSFVTIDKKRLNDPEFLKSRRKFRIFIFITRVIIFSLIFDLLSSVLAYEERQGVCHRFGRKNTIGIN